MSYEEKILNSFIGEDEPAEETEELSNDLPEEDEDDLGEDIEDLGDDDGNDEGINF